MKSRRGEIATTLTLISLLLAGIGTLVGARVTVQQRQQTQTLAAGASGCGMSCSKNSDCMRSVTNSSGEEVTLACDMRVKKCLAASGERDRCDDVSGGGGSGGNCGVDCRNDRDCNNTDATDSSIRLHCDFTIGRAAGRGRCQGFPNGKQCPNIPTPTSRFAGGGTTGGSGGLSPIPSGFRLPSGDPFPTGALRGGTPGPTFVATTQAPQTGGGTSSSPQGNRFSTAALRCGGTFRVEIDPVIDRILIRGGSGQSYVLGNADEVSGSDTGRRSPVGYRMWMSFSRQQIDNIKVDFSEGVQRNGRRAVYLGLRSGGHPDPDLNQDAAVDMYYFSSVPAFVFDGTPKTIELEYHVQGNRSGRAGTPEYFQQSISTNGCSASTTTIITTPSATQTPPRTPTPSRTATPTAETAPPPSPCSTNVHFLIDASETMRQFIEPSMTNLVAAINDYARADFARNDNITVTRQFFYRDVEGSSSPKSARTITDADFAFPRNKHWTNIHDALQQGIRGTTVFISDGLPSVRKYALQEKAWCVFGNGPAMSGGGSDKKADGCEPDANVSGKFNNNRPSCSPQCTTKTYSDAYRESKSGSAQFSVFVATPDGDRGFMESVANETINFSDLPNKLHEIFNAACNRPAQGFLPTGRGTGSASRSGSSQSFMSSFTMQNNSSRTLSGIRTEVCSGSGSCVTSSQPVLLGPGQSSRVSSLVGNVPLQGTFNVRNTLLFADGGEEQGSSRTLSRTNGVQYSLQLQDNGTRSTVKTYTEASDVNGDGEVNTLDAATCARSYGSADVRCDIVSDGTVNAQDNAALIGNAGSSTQ